MKDRACKVSDIRLFADLRIVNSGLPQSEDLRHVAAADLHWRGDGDGDGDGYGSFYWCINCDYGEFHSFEQALDHVGDAEASGLLARLSVVRTAGRPRRGPAGAAEQRWVREHLDEVNARLAADGLRQIDPTNPAHVKRYGLETRE